LVRRIIAKSVAPSTLQQYQRRWNQWTEHCHTQGVPLYRPSLPHLLGYLATISETSSVNVVYHHLSAINYFHRVELLPAVTDDELVGIFMKGLKRMELEKEPPAITRAKPMTPDILLKLAALVDGDITLRNFRTIWRIFVCYYCLLRWDDVRKLRSEDLEYDPEAKTIRVKIHPGKTGNSFIHDFSNLPLYYDLSYYYHFSYASPTP